MHCNLPGTDAAGAVKAMMDVLYEDFINERLPQRVKISTSCCQINCGGQADIAINLQHHHPPKINHDNMKICEHPKVVAICPVAAIRPAKRMGRIHWRLLRRSVCIAVRATGSARAWR